MTILCFDADVVLNVLLKEAGLWRASFQLLQKVERGMYEGMVWKTECKKRDGGRMGESKKTGEKKRTRVLTKKARVW